MARSLNTAAEAHLDHFDELWHSGVQPDVAAFVRDLRQSVGLEVTPQLVCEIASIDLECRWKIPASATDRSAAHRWRAEHYRQLFPELVGDLWRGLVLWEFEIRRRWGDNPSITEFEQRFPDLAPQLSQALAGALRTQNASTQNAQPPLPGDEPRSPGVETEDERFRPMELHARGGLGEVFVAEDSELNRVVALKRLRNRFADDPERRLRFRAEGEITGRLEHPGIVPIYGMGTDSCGRLYYAMRFIRGETLASSIEKLHACQDRETFRLELRKLLGRMVTAAAAVEYAHSRGVVHRDLKPLNIMLGKFHETLVVDWGMAIGVEPEDSHPGSESIVRTPGMEPIHQGVSGTLEYMSPEQAGSGLETIGRHSDIFSLGATMYAILTGQAPFRTLEAARRCEFPPPRQVKSAIPRALEAICMKAMAPLARHRYQSAMELGNEIERWLNDEPVQAHRGTTWERVERWSRRHRGLVQGAMLASILVSLAALTTVWLTSKAQAETERQREIAHKNLRLAMSAVDKLLTQVGQERLDNIPQFEDVRASLLSDALEYYEQFRRNAPADPESRLDVARAHHRVADIERIRHQTDRAEKEYEKAIREFSQLAIEFPDQPVHRYELGLSQNWLGVLLRSTQPAKARQAYDRAVATQQRLEAEFPGDWKYPVSTARSFYNRGIVRQEVGDLSGSDADYQAAGERLTKVLAQATGVDPSTVLDCRFQLARVENNLAKLASVKNQWEAASAGYQRAIQLAAELHRQHPLRRDIEKELATYRHNLAELQFNRAQLGEQTTAFAEAAVAENAAAIQHFTHLASAIPALRNELANSYNTQAGLLEFQQKVDEAQSKLERAIELFESLHAEFPSDADYKIRLAMTLSNRGRLMLATSDPTATMNAKRDAERAIRLFGEAISLRGRTVELQSDLRDAYGVLIVAELARHDHAAAATAIVEYGREPVEFDRLVDAAEFLCSCSTAALADNQLAEASRQPVADGYRGRAMTALLRSVELGLKDPTTLDIDGFKPLHDDPRFKQLQNRLREQLRLSPGTPPNP